MKRIATAFALLLFVSAPLALSGCSADDLAGPDAYNASNNGNGNGNGSGNDSHNGGSTNPDRDILD